VKVKAQEQPYIANDQGRGITASGEIFSTYGREFNLNVSSVAIG
jgi:hypothetical protein